MKKTTKFHDFSQLVVRERRTRIKAKPEYVLSSTEVEIAHNKKKEPMEYVSYKPAIKELFKQENKTEFNMIKSILKTVAAFNRWVVVFNPDKAIIGFKSEESFYFIDYSCGKMTMKDELGQTRNIIAEFKIIHKLQSFNWKKNGQEVFQKRFV